MNLYMKRSLRSKLKSFFIGEKKSLVNKKTGMWSQIGQDYFSYLIHNQKRNGFFVEVGGYHPYLYSNSLFLESELGWDGIIFEIDKIACELIKKKRNCSIIESDILKIEQETLSSYIPKRVDFLSIDIDPNISNLKALKKFIDLPSRYSFITFEHNQGRNASKNSKIQEEGFKELSSRSYKRIAKDVLLNSKSTEDWYIDINAEEFLNYKVINALNKTSNVEYLEIIEMAKKVFSEK